jgi:hypothetical protein
LQLTFQLTRKTALILPTYATRVLTQMANTAK